MTTANAIAAMLAAPFGPLAVIAVLAPVVLIVRARTRRRRNAAPAEATEPVYAPTMWDENAFPSHAQWVDWFLACNRPAQEAIAALAHADANVAGVCFQRNHNQRIRDLTERLAEARAAEAAARESAAASARHCAHLLAAYNAKVRDFAIETWVTTKAAEWARQDPSRAGLLAVIADAHATAPARGGALTPTHVPDRPAPPLHLTSRPIRVTVPPPPMFHPVVYATTSNIRPANATMCATPAVTVAQDATAAADVAALQALLRDTARRA